MKRNAMQSLIDWKNRAHRKPMIIRGARQVGKTWLMKEFGRCEFEKTAYINFDKNDRMKLLFEGDFDIKRILRGLSIESGVNIEPQNTLIILDEVQEVPAALGSLKYFSEDESTDYYILAAGSLLGIALHSGTSFPVGKTAKLDMYPLTFTEFLDALGETNLLELLRERDFQMITAFKSKFIDFLKLYYYIGGMPEAVYAYVQNGDLKEVRDIQLQLISDYEQDFSKHAPAAVVPRIQMVWDGIPSQLAKENKKFIYSVLREGARAKDFEIAIQWLLDCGLCHKVGRVTKGGIPLKTYRDLPSFKLYLVDVGLLAAMADMDEKSLLRGNAIFTNLRAKSQNSLSACSLSPSRRDTVLLVCRKLQGELDFVIQYSGQVLPIEVPPRKPEAKSLQSFIEANNLPTGIRTSMSDYRVEPTLINLPLYAFSELYPVFDSIIN